MYNGYLGSDSARFQGQDSTDIYLSQAAGAIRYRQHVFCTAQGITVVYYEQSLNGGVNWIDSAPLAQRIEWNNLGPTAPLGHVQPGPINPAPGIPPAGPGWQQPAAMIVNGHPVSGYQLPWYQGSTMEHIHGGAIRPIHYYQHERRKGHTLLHTPQMKPNGKTHTFLKLEYKPQIQSYRLASS